VHTWHLTFSTDGRNPLFPDEYTRRRALRVLARVAGSRSALFAIVDEHLHLVLFCDRQRAGRLARATLIAVRPLAAAVVEPAHRRAVQSRSHMSWLLDYLLTQPRRHGLPVHPAIWTGSPFPDLIGARQLPGLELKLRKALPRFRIRDLYRAVGLSPGGPLLPLPLETVRAQGIARLVAATTSALAVGPSLRGNRAELVHARRVAAQLAHQCGISLTDTAWALKLTPRAARRLLEPEQDSGPLEAVRLWLALENAVQAIRH